MFQNLQPTRPSSTWLTAPQGLTDAHAIVKYTLRKTERQPRGTPSTLSLHTSQVLVKEL
jgi:hypothetical protein